jgi:hypothetical protein
MKDEMLVTGAELRFSSCCKSCESSSLLDTGSAVVEGSFTLVAEAASLWYSVTRMLSTRLNASVSLVMLDSISHLSSKGLAQVEKLNNLKKVVMTGSL